MSCVQTHTKDEEKQKLLTPIKTRFKPIKAERYAHANFLHSLANRGLSKSPTGSFVSAPAAHWLVVGRSFEAQDCDDTRRTKAVCRQACDTPTPDPAALLNTSPGMDSEIANHASCEYEARAVPAGAVESEAVPGLRLFCAGRLHPLRRMVT